MLTMKIETSYRLEFNEDDRINLVAMLEDFVGSTTNSGMEELAEEYLAELKQGE